MGSIKTISIIVAANIKGLESGLGKANKSLTKFAKTSARLGSMMSFGITAPLVALGKSAFDTFSNFENGMMKVKTITGATAEEFKMLTAEAKRLGATTQFTAQQVADLQLVFGRKGFNPKQIMSMESSVLKLALATGEDLSLAANTVASSINAFGLSAEHAASVANTLASASANSSIQLSTFSTAFGHAGTAANSVGVDFNQLAGMMGVLMDNGIKASKAGTGLRKIFIELAQKGIPFSETLDRIAKGEMDIIDASTMAGKTAAAQLLILSKNKKKVDELAKSYAKNTDRLDEMAKAMGETTFAKVKKMQSAIEGLKLELGALLAEIVVPIIGRITSFASGFANLDDTTKKLIITVGGIMAVLGPVLIGVGALIALLNPVTIGIGLLGGAFALLALKSSSVTDNLIEEQTALSNLAERAMSANEGSEKRIELIKELQTEYPDFLKNMEAEKIANEDIKNAIDESNTSFLKKLQLQAESEKLQELMNEKSKKGRELNAKENEALEALRKIYKTVGFELSGNLSTQTKLEKTISNITGEYIAVNKNTTVWIGTLGANDKITKNTRENLEDLRDELSKDTNQFDTAAQAVADYLKKLDEIGSTAAKAKTPLPTPTGTPTLAPTLGLGVLAPPPFIGPLNEVTKSFSDKVKDAFTSVQGTVGEIFGTMQKNGKTTFENIAMGVEAAFSGINEVLNTQFDLQIAKDQELFDRKKSLMEESAAYQSATSKKQAELLRKLEEDSFKKSNKIKKKQAKLDKAQAMFSAIVQVASQVAANVAVPPLAIAIGIAGAIQIAAIAAQPIPAFANGGIVSGPTLGLMGEYSGARSNPEVIAPLDKLQGMMGSQNIRVQVYGSLDSEGIQIATIKGNKIAAETGGETLSTSNHKHAHAVGGFVGQALEGN